MKKYPPDWPEIAERIKKKNGYRCEKCKHKHDPDNGYCLTVHHLDRDPQNNEEYNLASLCQRCHLPLEVAAVRFEYEGLNVFTVLNNNLDLRPIKLVGWFKPHWEGYLRSKNAILSG